MINLYIRVSCNNTVSNAFDFNTSIFKVSGSGSGSLVLPLAYLLPQVQFVALDMNGESVRILKERA